MGRNYREELEVLLLDLGPYSKDSQVERHFLVQTINAIARVIERERKDAQWELVRRMVPETPYFRTETGMAGGAYKITVGSTGEDQPT